MRILVVEDEALVRKDIVNTLNQCGYPLVVEAKNGREALSLLEKSSVDLIFSDVEMPLMNGIELLQELDARRASFLFVIISGYDLFQYVQQAISLGAFDYLLKPISQKDIAQILRKAENHLRKENAHRDYTQHLEDTVNDMHSTTRNRFFRAIVQPGDRTFDQIMLEYKEIVTFFPNSHFVQTALRPCFPNTSFSTEEIQFFFSYLTQQETETVKIFPFLMNPFTEEDSAEQIYVLLNTLFDTDTVSLAVDLYKRLNEVMPNGFQFSVGQVVDSPNRLETSLSTALKAFSQLPAAQGCHMFVYQAQEYLSTNPFDMQAEKQLQLLVEGCKPQESMDHIHSFYDPINVAFSSASESFKKLNLSILLCLYKILADISLSPEELLGNEFYHYRKLNELLEAKKIYEYYAALLTPVFAILTQRQNREEHLLIARSKEYIYAHFDQDLTLERVALHIHLTPTYFSRYFKQETGINFIDYLTEVRLAHARKLLKKTNLKISDIAKSSGFPNLRYFYRIFKQHLKITPSEYREGLRK